MEIKFDFSRGNSFSKMDEEGSEGSNTSDLNKTFWSARISVKLDHASSHERVKHLIPLLDLSKLPTIIIETTESESNNNAR